MLKTTSGKKQFNVCCDTKQFVPLIFIFAKPGISFKQKNYEIFLNIFQFLFIYFLGSK
jgi:hypothetical protein